MDQFKQLGATLVAVSPQVSERSAKLISSRKLGFEILHDEDNQYAESLGLKHGFSPKLKDVYLKLGLNLDDFNGNQKWELPIASRFVIDTDGIIQSADVNADYTIRPEPEETTAVLKSIAG